ncbi:MAG: PspC domain-containing protein [Candidatus Azobacteroides sp.]|nr:PspC domain-containing protein [Candidatus Azobacteroides sp.]
MKKLKRSSNKMIGGVAAGIAEYLDLDPTIIRIIWAVSVIFAGFGFFAYIICWIIMPSAQS